MELPFQYFVSGSFLLDVGHKPITVYTPIACFHFVLQGVPTSVYNPIAYFHFVLLGIFTTVYNPIASVHFVLQGIQIEADPSLVSAYIIFLSQHTADLPLLELNDLALVRNNVIYIMFLAIESAGSEAPDLHTV